MWIKPRGNSPRLHSAMPLGLKSAFLRPRRPTEGCWGSDWPVLSPRWPCEAVGEGQSGLESAFLRQRRLSEGRWGSDWAILSPGRASGAGGEGQSGLESAFLRPRQHLQRLSGSKEQFLSQRRHSEGRWGSDWAILSPGRPTEGCWGSDWSVLSPRRPAEGVTEGRPEGPQPMSSAGPMRKTSEKAAPGRQGGTNSTARSAMRARRFT